LEDRPDSYCAHSGAGVEPDWARELERHRQAGKQPEPTMLAATAATCTMQRALAAGSATNWRGSLRECSDLRDARVGIARAAAFEQAPMSMQARGL